MKKINPVIVFSVLYILGVISFYMELVIPFAVSILICVLFCIFKNTVTNRKAVIFYLAFVLAVFNCSIQTKDFDGLSPYVPAKGVITGEVLNIPSLVNDRSKFYFKVTALEIENNKYENLDAKTIVTLNGTPEKLAEVKPADKLEITGKLRNPIRATNPSQFDYSKYLKYHKTFSTFYSDTDGWVVLSSPQTLRGKFLQRLNDKRNDILKIHERYVKSPNLEVLGGIVFGDDAITPPEEIKTSFINSGLLHILAASGMNVSIIFGIWFFVGMRLRLNYRFVVFAGAMLVIFYTLMTGMGASVLRAALMIEFVLLGKLFDRNADSIALVFFVALLMLLYNPAMINDVGFQLSFVVTFALMFYCPPVLEKIKNKFAEFALGGVLIPFVAQLFAAPIQMFYFNSFAVYSVLANFAITPFIMIISFLGFLSSIFAMIPVLGSKICMVFDCVLNPVVTILVNISNTFSELPHSLLTTGHPSYLQIILYYSLLMIFGFLLRNRFNNRKLLVVFFSVLILFAMSLIKLPKKDCEILVFDVGNADSFLIKTPGQKYIMIDTARGSTEGAGFKFSQAEAIIGKYLKDCGIKEIELMIVTHFDSDHSGGTVDLMKLFSVKKILISKENGENESGTKTTKNIYKYIKENHIDFDYAPDNKIVFKENDFVVRTYTPDFKENKSDNDNSTITLLSYGDFDMLFMADGGVKSFEKIKQNLNNNKTEIVKTGHHGAKDTVSREMLEFINPDAAVLSTGLNIYGHPHKETLSTLYENNIKIYRTDLNRAIKITSNKKDYSVYFYDNGKRRFYKVQNKTL